MMGSLVSMRIANVVIPSLALFSNVVTETLRQKRTNKEDLRSTIVLTDFAAICRVHQLHGRGGVVQRRGGMEKVWYDKTDLLVEDPQKSANLLMHPSPA